MSPHYDEPGMLTWPQLADQIGVSYRKLDYWIRRGYLLAVMEGSGYVREVDPTEEDIARLMVRLIGCGLSVEAAAIAARRMIYDGLNTTTLPGGVILILEEEHSATEG